jgi:hypothetical protein
MVRLRTLTPSIEVRILVGHPAFSSIPAGAAGAAGPQAAVLRFRPSRDDDWDAGLAAPSRQEQQPQGERDYGGRNDRGPALRPPPPPLRGSRSDCRRGERSYCDGPDQIRRPATRVNTNKAQAAPTSRISAREGSDHLDFLTGSSGFSASSCIQLPLRHRCARLAGRLIAREHREPRPAYSPEVLYSAGHPTEAGACVRRASAGAPSRSRLGALDGTTPMLATRQGR